jgi:hypothetical protein
MNQIVKDFYQRKVDGEKRKLKRLERHLVYKNGIGVGASLDIARAKAEREANMPETGNLSVDSQMKQCENNIKHYEKLRDKE